MPNARPWGLAQLGPDAQPALLDLIYALSYDEESVSVAVSSAIVPMGSHAVGALMRSLEDSNFFVRRRARDDSGTHRSRRRAGDDRAWSIV